jgi:phospholipid-translocating ATPase
MINEEKSILNGEVSGCKAKNLELIQDFAMVNNIFCDKTGTLTQNKLIFRMFIVNAKTYSVDDGFDVFKQIILNSPQDEKFKNFMRCICICHDVITMISEGKHSYQGANQDEITFLEMCKRVGYCYCKERDDQFITIVLDEAEERYEILRMIEFTSERKMMSVIVKRNDGKIINFVKGGDISMLPRLNPASITAEKDSIDLMNEHAAKGLRTLMFGFKMLEEKEDIKNADSSKLENGLEMLGVTGLEDCLQENVANCIKDLRRANIKLWMLTGDKGETAHNIAIACGLIDPSL